METDLQYVIRRLTEFASHADRIDNSVKLDVSTVIELKRLLERAAENFGNVLCTVSTMIVV